MRGLCSDYGRQKSTEAGTLNLVPKTRNGKFPHQVKVALSSRTDRLDWTTVALEGGVGAAPKTSSSDVRFSFTV
jgi:hypothetical protein